MYLHKPNVRGFLSERLATHVQPILADYTRFLLFPSNDAEEGQIERLRLA